MRFWLRWAIVTLPLACSLFLWGQSYWFENQLKYGPPYSGVSLWLNRGAVAFIVQWYDGKSTKEREWQYTRYYSERDNPRGSILGFAVLSRAAGYGDPHARALVLPMWFITLLAAMPPLWLYRRQRKRSKIGFPIEPVGIQDHGRDARATVNSKESTPAQTD